ncbi:MAG: HU family DNA-binding protein [Cytophagaceae bacterium]
MNKGELIEAIASESNLTKADAKRALDSFLNVSSKALKKGDKVIIIGFGTFSVVKREARKGRNPKTGKPMVIKARKVVKFKAGVELAKKIK